MAIPWLCLVILPVASQLVHQWTSQLGGKSDDGARALQVDVNGNAWVAGDTENSLDGNTNKGLSDMFLMKFDAQGVHLWTRQRGGEGWDHATALQVDPVGNALVSGYTPSSLDGNANKGFRDIFLMKFDAQGVHQWTRQRGGKYNDDAHALQVDSVGNALVAGWTQSFLDGNANAGRWDIFLMKFHAQGVHLWTRLRGGESSDQANALEVDSVGNAWVAGSTTGLLDGNANKGFSDIFLMKFDARGVHQWTCQRGGESYDDAKALQVDVNGNALVAGRTGSSLDGNANKGLSDIFLMKFDARGVHLWTRQRGGEGYDYAKALQVDVSGHAWMAGYTESSLDGHSNAGGMDIFIMKFDAEGVHQWTHQRGGEDHDQAYALQVDPTGNDVWIAGHTKSSLDGYSNAGGKDIFLMKFQAECSHVTCPAGYMQNPSQSNSTCCVQSSTPPWTTSTTASISITTTSSTKVSTSITRTKSSTTASTRTSSRTVSTSTSTRSTTRASTRTTSRIVSTSSTKTSTTMKSLTSTLSVTSASASAGAEAALPAPPGLPVSQLEGEEHTSTATASVDVEIWEKPGIPNAQSINLGVNTATASSENDLTGLSSEDDSTGLLVAVVVLLLLTACLCASLGICCYRAKLRHLQGAEAEPQVPNPLAILPPFVWSVKPLIFSWNSRMTAEWPRGKVQKLSVSETAFELSGRQFHFQPGQVRHFTWEDGTVQMVQSIQKNVVWWSREHPHPAWQRFRWVCTPKCQVENHHDMELTDSESDGYRCTSCSRLRAAGKHWYCPQHQVRVCPVCAELPPEMPTLGLAAAYLVDTFPPLARSATGKENPNFYDICPTLAHGSAGMGYNRTCPRDGRSNCSIVDALEDAHSGKVTHFVSWCWAYSLNNVVSAIERWLQKSKEDPQNVFLWMCFFCNNQYRIKEEATQTGSDELREIFESHLVEAGRMLVLLDTIVQPTYVERAWCIFESYVCIAQEIPMNIILPAAADAFFRETMSRGRIDVLSGAVSKLNVRHARAGSKKDEDLIKRIIFNTIGFDAVNEAVRSKLVDQLTILFRELLLPQPS